MKKLFLFTLAGVLTIACAVALGGCGAGAVSDINPSATPAPGHLTLQDYAPLIEEVIKAVDAYADEKVGLPDTPETRLLMAAKGIAVQAALLPLRKAGFSESQIIAYIEEKNATKVPDSAKTALQDTKTIQQAVEAVAKAAEVYAAKQDAPAAVPEVTPLEPLPPAPSK